MALPRIYQKLFQNEGASSVLRPDIVPSCAAASVATFNSETSGEYTLTGDKKQADGYPYDTSDAVYFKVINTGDELIQYWYHGNVMLVRYKKGTDGTWSSWEQVGKDVTSELEELGDKIINGDNELAAQIQQLSVADSALLGQITSVEERTTTAEGSITTNTTDISGIKTRLDTVEGTASTNTTDISGIKTRLDTVEGTASTNTINITTIFDRLDVTSNWESTALMHNNIYRGANLLGDGHFASIAAVMAALRAGNFDDIYVGDYIPASITVDGTTYSNVPFRIAAINLLNARNGIWGTRSPNLCIVPDAGLGRSYMNSTDTSVGGYVGSYMYTTVLPKYYAAIAGNSGAPFNGYLETTTERLTNGIDTSKTCNGYSGWTGAASGVSDYDDQNLTLMSEVEVYGHNHWSSTAWDGGTIAVQLPMFRLNPNTITDNGSRWWWLRGVTDSTRFCYAAFTLEASYYFASDLRFVRPRFFIA